MKSALALSLILGVSSWAGDPKKVDQTLKDLQKMPLIGSTSCATPTPTPVSGDAEAPRAYFCKIIPAGSTPLPPLKKNPLKGDEITLTQDNDNTMLVFMEYGDDMGYTNGMSASYLHHLDAKNPEKNKTIAFDLMSELYTEETKWHPSPGKNYAVNFLDVTRLKATYQQGKSFYFLMGVGIEDRQTQMRKNQSKLTPEASIQDHWHQAFDLDIYQYDPAKKSSPVSQFSRTSMIAEAGAGKKTQLYEGHCELDASAKVSLSTEDRTLIGRNSNASVNGGAKVNFLKTRTGNPRFNAGLDASVLYFPKSLNGIGNLGGRGRVTLQSNFNVGKKDHQLQPFLQFTLPVGRQIFSPVTDKDAVQRIGLRFIFGP